MPNQTPGRLQIACLFSSQMKVNWNIDLWAASGKNLKLVSRLSPSREKLNDVFLPTCSVPV